MAVSQIEEKILGRLAEETAPTNALLSASLYQVLGLSILLSRKLYRARKLRKLDNTRDTKSLQLYHHIIWLAREGLSITEVYILPYCQRGEHGSECRVMAAKLRASLYHVFCLFHNHPPISQINARSPESGSPPSSTKTVKGMNGSLNRSPPKKGDDAAENRRRPGKAALRDAIPSMVSEASYITNPYASGQSPPPGLFLPTEARRTPTRPPGLPAINIAASQAAATFLLPPLNFLPMVREHFTTAQQLASSLLSPTHALRLSVALEHAAFLWDCAKEHERARKLARRTIREVYSSSDGLDDDEFADVSALVQALGGIVKRGSNESTPVKPDTVPASEPVASKSVHRVPRKPVPPPSIQKPKQQHIIDRTISVSPEANRRKGTRTAAAQPTQIPVRATIRSPERLSTVPEMGESTDEAARSVTHTTFSAPASRQGTVSPPTSRQPTASPPMSRLSSRIGRRENRTERASSTASASDKASKRKIVEQAEEDLRRRQSRSNRSNASGSPSTESKVRRRRSSEKRGGNGETSSGSQHELHRRGSGSNASGGGGGGDSQPHSRQATPPEGLSTKSSKGSNNQTKRARRRQARQNAASGVGAGGGTPAVQDPGNHSTGENQHLLPPTPPPTVPPPAYPSPTRPLPLLPNEKPMSNAAYRGGGAAKTRSPPTRPLPPVPTTPQTSNPAHQDRRSSEKQESSLPGDVQSSLRQASQQATYPPSTGNSRDGLSRDITVSDRISAHIDERRDAIIRTLEIISAVSRGFVATRPGKGRTAGMRVV